MINIPDREKEMERRAANSAVGKLPTILKEHTIALKENTEAMIKLTETINTHLSLEAVRKNFRI